MPEKKSDSVSAIGFMVHVLLVVGLLLTLLGTYTAFVILPSEWADGRGEADLAFDAAGHDLLDAPRTGAAPSPLLYSGMPDWRTVVHLENTGEIRPDLVITATDLGDSLLAVDEFSAKIVLAGDEAQVLPGVAFVAEKPGRYVARRIALPENGEWELRASLRRGHQTLLVGQKISALLPQTKE